eukprot:Platyproteum_vivax@DN10087_c0_g1_i1.p1
MYIMLFIFSIPNVPSVGVLFYFMIGVCACVHPFNLPTHTMTRYVCPPSLLPINSCWCKRLSCAPNVAVVAIAVVTAAAVLVVAIVGVEADEVVAVVGVVAVDVVVGLVAVGVVVVLSTLPDPVDTCFAVVV